MRPLHVDVVPLARPVDVRQFDAHVHRQQAVCLGHPVNAVSFFVVRLQKESRDSLKHNSPRKMYLKLFSQIVNQNLYLGTNSSYIKCNYVKKTPTKLEKLLRLYNLG